MKFIYVISQIVHKYCRNMFAIVLVFFFNEPGHYSIVSVLKSEFLLTTCAIVCFTGARNCMKGADKISERLKISMRFSFQGFAILGLPSRRPKFGDLSIFTISLQINSLKFHTQCNSFQYNGKLYRKNINFLIWISAKILKHQCKEKSGRLKFKFYSQLRRTCRCKNSGEKCQSCIVH